MEKQICLSLVYQHLLHVNPGLAKDFDDQYKPEKALVKVEDVLARWEEEQVARVLVYNHLKDTVPALAKEFKVSRYFSEEVLGGDKAMLNINDIFGKLTTAQLTRGLVYGHLERVAPALAKEFKDAYPCISSMVPVKLSLILEESLLKYNKFKITKLLGEKNYIEKMRREGEGNGRLGEKQARFTDEQVNRLSRAIENKENITAVAREMGRTYKSVKNKVIRMKAAVTQNFKLGKLSPEEDCRLRKALIGKEDYKEVAKELGRKATTVRNRMARLSINPESGRKRTGFTLKEDLVILDKIIPQLATQRLSHTGFLPQSALFEIGSELGKFHTTVVYRWGTILQPWLLQHFTGTSGFRVERMLANLVAEKWQDQKEIDFVNLVLQHKEFAGHTHISLSHIYSNLLQGAKKKLKLEYTSVTLQDVACYVSQTYKPGMEKKESTAVEMHRESFISAFKEKLTELGINVKI